VRDSRQPWISKDRCSHESSQGSYKPPSAFSGSVWIKSYHDANLPATCFPKVVKVGLGRQVVNKAWRRAINHGLSRSRARSWDIYPNAHKLCVCPSSSILFQRTPRAHYASSTMINVKNSAIKSEKKSAGDEGGGRAPLVQILAVHLSSAVGFDPR